MKRSWLSVAWVHKAAITIGRLLAGLARLPTKFFSGPFQAASTAYRISLPKDHGRHPDFRSEWWYVAGNLTSPQGTEWGYQFTVFRHSCSVSLGHLGELRAPFDTYMGHLVVTNVTEQVFAFSDTIGLAVLGQAGASLDRLEVWLRSMKLEEINGKIFVRARQKDFGVFVELVSQKPAVLLGDNGVIGKAAHCYAFTSLRTQGEIIWQGKTHLVHGKSFLEREFGSRMLPDSVQGWDWFMLILDNDVELILAAVRLSDGSVVPQSYGVVVCGGTWHPLTLPDFTVKQLGSWKSGSTKAIYPMGWVAGVPSADLEVTIHPCIESHELVSAIPGVPDYWEGPVRVSGNVGGKQVEGRGYAELVGYAQPIGGKI